MSSAPANTSPGSNPRPRAPRHRGALVAWALLLAYASLYPFLPIRLPGEDAPALFLRPKFISEFDVFMNVAAYAPFGALACLHFMSGRARWSARWRAVLLAATVSLAMELSQFFIATRVASLFDVLANTAAETVRHMQHFRQRQLRQQLQVAFDARQA